MVYDAAEEKVVEQPGVAEPYRYEFCAGVSESDSEGTGSTDRDRRTTLTHTIAFRCSGAARLLIRPCLSLSLSVSLSLSLSLSVSLSVSLCAPRSF